MPQLICFYFFATMLILAALRVVTTRNPVHAALFLVLSFFSASCLWMLIHAEFLAVGLILIYVGAVMVLFLFVVMMMNLDIEALRRGFWKGLPVASVVAVVMVSELVLLLTRRGNDVISHAAPADMESNSRELGRAIFGQYIYPFELAAVLLLIAIVAAIALTLRHRKNTKSQDPGLQSKVKREDRVRLVSMMPEKSVNSPDVE